MTRRPIPALVAALGVLAFLILRELAQVVVYFTAFPYVASQLLSSIGNDAAFALGVFLVLWAILPVAAQTSLPRTIVSGVVAAVVGCLLMVVAALLTAFVIQVPYAQPLGVAFSTVLLTALALMPLTVLAAVLVREWSRSKAVVDAPQEPAAAV